MDLDFGGSPVSPTDRMRGGASPEQHLDDEDEGYEGLGLGDLDDSFITGNDFEWEEPEYELPDSDCEADMDEDQKEAYKEAKHHWWVVKKNLLWQAALEVYKACCQVGNKPYGEKVLSLPLKRLEPTIGAAYHELLFNMPAVGAYLRYPDIEIDPDTNQEVDGDKAKHVRAKKLEVSKGREGGGTKSEETWEERWSRLSALRLQALLDRRAKAPEEDKDDDGQATPEMDPGAKAAAQESARNSRRGSRADQSEEVNDLGKVR